jgi:hypothetical protein
MKRYIRAGYPRVDELLGYGILVQNNSSARYGMFAFDAEHTAKGCYEALKAGDTSKAYRLLDRYGEFYEHIDMNNVQDDGTINMYTGYIQLLNPDDAIIDEWGT